jgi:nitroreductase
MLVEAVSPRLGDGDPPADDNSVDARNLRMYRRFILEFEKIPVIILTLVENAFPTAEAADVAFAWSSVYAATQNLLLAARGLGIGAAMTTNHLENEQAVREHFKIPDNWEIGATIPLGYPEGKYGPLTRNPVPEVMFRNSFGNDWA